MHKKKKKSDQLDLNFFDAKHKNSRLKALKDVTDGKLLVLTLSLATNHVEA